VFLIDGTGHRCPWSANGKSTAAPVLEITYRRKPKAPPPPLACRVQLVFAEPRLDIRAGQRPFACWVNGERVGQLDLCESDGARTAHVLDLPAVAVQEWLEIRLEPTEGAALPPLLSGVSVRVER
jgi:hypothetical protein